MAWLKQADDVSDHKLAVWELSKMVTEYNESTEDWSGQTSDFGFIGQGNTEVSSLQELLEKVKDEFGLDEVFDSEPIEHNPSLGDRYGTNQTENDEGYSDPKGKYLADYSLYVKWYKSIEAALSSEATSDEAQKWISEKIKKLVDEGKPQDQAVAIALSMAREKGYSVPEKKSSLDICSSVDANDDSELINWILNDEGLYGWARSERVPVDEIGEESSEKFMQFLNDNRQEIANAINKVVDAPPRQPSWRDYASLKTAGLSTQVRNLKKRLRDMDTSKCNPAEVRDVVDALESLEKRLDAEKERKQKKREEKDAASAEAETVEAAYEGRGGPGETFPNTPGDEASIRELTLWAENTSEIYGQKESIIKNIARRIKNGTYDPNLAPKLWRYWFDSASQSYKKEFGYSFPPAIRQAAADAYAPEMYEEIVSGNWSILVGELPKPEASMEAKADAVPPQPAPETATPGMKWVLQNGNWTQVSESEQTVPMKATASIRQDEYALFK